MWNSSENAFSKSSSFREDAEDEEALRWATLQRLPTYSRVRKGIFRDLAGELSEVEVTEMKSTEQRVIIDRLLSSVDNNPERFFQRMRSRFDAVDLRFPKVEVRFQNLTVESYVHVGSRALPTIPNFIFNICEALLRGLRIYRGNRTKLTILDDVTGIIRPSRMTLLLGPPGSGKTTLLLALAGRLLKDLNESGRITYNGHEFTEFMAPRTAAYVGQQDCHIAEMTVRESLEFARRCQGVGFKHDMILELARREKDAGIKPDDDLDIFLKALALDGSSTSLAVEFIMKILGLDTCADTMVGDQMVKGISGGQKKRLTTGELIVGPARVLFMDEISNGLDSSVTYHITNYLKHLTGALNTTTMVSLLQPSPETFELFDDVVLLCEGQIVYQGPRESALDFFSSLGFTSPERKNIADFLQEVTSRKDQKQYWSSPCKPYKFISPSKFSEAFQSNKTGKTLQEELQVPFNKRRNHPAALSTFPYGMKKLDLLKTCYAWQKLLMKRNSFIYIFKYTQIFIVALITTSVFFRTEMHRDKVRDGELYLGAIYFSTVIILFNGFTEVSMLVAKLSVLYKQRNLHFYPSWAYTIPYWILSIPTSLMESGIWVVVSYYGIGYDPDITRFLRQFLLFFLVHQMSIGLFRVIGSLGRNMIVSNTFGSFTMLGVMALGGYVVTRDCIPNWMVWGFWVSPLMYAQNAASVNEFLGNSWMKRSENSTGVPLGKAVLKYRSMFDGSYWYWIGVGVLLCYAVLFNIMFTVFLAYLNPWEQQQAVISKQELQERERGKKGISEAVELRHYLEYSGPLAKQMKGKGMVLPFQPLCMSFSNINYFVEVPTELKQEFVTQDRLQLLHNITGAFRPGILTALVGESGAGKTTLMDVLAGRKTGGVIEGDIHISGYPKKQETFARISGYCEQTDIHSPCLTLEESLIFSAWLRLPPDVPMQQQQEFVDEVMELVELTRLRTALVGLPGVNGLSIEQRKRLTIAVELVANPSIVFMDEPTSGLDARAAAIVMRTVRNIVNTGRTIVCTIHQPSVDIFESFDELLFMKRGGELIYAGPLGPKSSELISYFEAIEGVPKIKPDSNPAAWILKVTSFTEETRLGINFSETYKQSHLYQLNEEMVEKLSKPFPITKDIHFPAKYSKSFLEQFLACLWKQNLSYWRNPQYTAVRFLYTCVISLMLGCICWKFGSKRSTVEELFNSMGSMYAAVLFIGITTAGAVQPVVSVERFVSYRERSAGMYSALPFAFAQVVIEIPYVFVQNIIYCSVFYFVADFERSVSKFAWYGFIMYFTMLYFTFYGMMTTAITPNHTVAAIISAPFYMLWNLFSGFVIPYQRIPLWWRWYYWANPISWTLYGLVVSQYGDDKRMMKMSDGRSLAVWDVVKEVLGLNHDLLGLSSIMVVGFGVLFAVIFAFAVSSFNFLRR